MNIPKRFFANSLTLNDNFFQALYQAMSWRNKKAAALILKIWLLVHPSSILAKKAFFLTVCQPTLLDQAKALFDPETMKESAGILAALLEESCQREDAAPFWKLALDSDDMRGHAFYLQVLLKREGITPERLLEECRIWAEKYSNSPVCEMSVRSDYAEDKPMRIGFCCGFFESPTMHNQFFPWLPYIAEAGHQIFLYGDTGFTDKNVTVRNGHFNMPPEDFQAMAKSDRLDILVETTGFSPGHRFQALARRCAPVQCSYLNHAGPTGVNNVDYCIADRLCIAPGEEKYYTEEMCYLPNSFFCFNFEKENMPYSESLPFDRNGCWTFGFFGSGSKLNDVFLNMIADSMNAVGEKSRLIMANPGLDYLPWHRQLKEKLQRMGISPERVTLYPRQTRETIAAFHKECDFTFDSYPYCGGNTLSEDLWYGVPGASFLGERFAARYGSSILKYSGLEDWIAHSREEFPEIYRRHANPEKMRELRKKLRSMMTAPGAYSDPKAFAKDFISGCREMIRSKIQKP